MDYPHTSTCLVRNSHPLGNSCNDARAHYFFYRDCIIFYLFWYILSLLLSGVLFFIWIRFAYCWMWPHYVAGLVYWQKETMISISFTRYRLIRWFDHTWRSCVSLLNNTDFPQNYTISYDVISLCFCTLVGGERKKNVCRCFLFKNWLICMNDKSYRNCFFLGSYHDLTCIRVWYTK